MVRRYLAKRNNPWELLAVAVLVAGPGLALLLQRHAVLFLNPGGRGSASQLRATVLSPVAAHVFGGFAVAFGVFLVVLYFYARIAIAHDEEARPPISSILSDEPSNQSLELTASRRATQFSHD